MGGRHCSDSFSSGCYFKLSFLKLSQRFHFRFFIHSHEPGGEIWCSQLLAGSAWLHADTVGAALLQSQQCMWGQREECSSMNNALAQ